MTPIDYSADIPSQLTRDRYLQIYRMTWAAIRYDLYQDLMEANKELPAGQQKLPEDIFADLYEIHLNSFE